MKEVVVITYTTKYRKGGNKFTRVAKTLAHEKEENGYITVCSPIESRKDLLSVFDSVKKEGSLIKEFHFIGHAGMYGPMYGTVEYPEQFSPYEIKGLKIPFAPQAEAYFHCCRSARWFAPYFARIQNVITYGYHWYTAFSKTKDFYTLDVSDNETKKLYCFGCPGKKSHGYLTSFKKHFGKLPAEQLKRFEPQQGEVDNTYNAVSELYNKVFTDIKIRHDEYSWIISHLPESKNIKILDIGCGNGALLKELSHSITSGVGVDISENLLTKARDNNIQNSHINFEFINGPELPFEEKEFDVVISMMSFRYLDWDPIMAEIQRILKPEGKLLIVDMVTAPVKLKEYPKLLKSKFRHYQERFKSPEFYRNLKELVKNPGWSKMLHYNPIRSEHEMKWYLESRFPDRKVEIINIGYNSRIIAFDSLNMKSVKNLSLSYP